MTHTKRFNFTYEQYDTPERQQSEFPHRSMVTAAHDFDVDCTWDVILDQFIHFLSSIYGYDISQSVSYEKLEDRIQRLRDQGVLYDDPEAWDDEQPCTKANCPACKNHY